MSVATILLLGLCLLSVRPTLLRGEDDAGARNKRRDLIALQLVTDMMYGTDDFFGEDRDTSYVDSLRPTPPLQPDQGPAQDTDTSKKSASDKGGQDGDSSPDDNTTNPGGGDPGTTDPPIDELPDEPDPDPGGGCPT